MSWACPKCKSTELEVNVSVWAELIQQDDDNFETDTSTPDNSSHEWDEESPMICRACRYTALSEEFEVAPAAPAGDLCDTCMRSGVEISHTHNGKTVCVECAEDKA